VRVSADVTRMTQVLGNLIHNSARYTDAGGQIELRVRRDESFAVVDVSDNGIGITAEALPGIFGLFVQGDSAAQDQKGGLGVGLTLVKRLVEAHGGTVSAASDGRGQGSRFTVSLPLASATV
jgi:signal transduction histidine kinase